MKIVLKFNVPFSYTSREMSHQIALRLDWFIILNSSFFIIFFSVHHFRFFLKVSYLFECRRDDPYMTANRNFIRFAHSQLNIRLLVLERYISPIGRQSPTSKPQTFFGHTKWLWNVHILVSQIHLIITKHYISPIGDNW